MNTEIIVVGGGASGMLAAIVAARRGKSVLLIEKKEKLGKKILATGNGKCNYSNTFYDATVYRSDNPEIVPAVLEQFSVEDTIAFFGELGIEPANKNGYLYPASMQASSIVEVLAIELARLNVNIHLNESVTDIKKKGGNYLVKTEQGNYQARAVILATGGKANSKLGSDGSGYAIAKAFGHTIVPVTEALVALRSTLKLFKQIAGVRCGANVTLYADGKRISEAQGELQLTDYGISGIPVFQVSRYATKALSERKSVEAILDFLPEKSEDETRQLLRERLTTRPDKTAEQFLIGVFPYKLAALLIKEAGIKGDTMVGAISSGKLEALLALIKHFKVPIVGANGFEQAQVCAGGVNATEIEGQSMESKMTPGLYMTGELLDVDGTCGGYNLQWAWSTGYVAGQHCLRKELI